MCLECRLSVLMIDDSLTTHATYIQHTQGDVIADNGEGPLPTTAEEIVKGWETNLAGLDAIHHQVRESVWSVKSLSHCPL